MSKWVRLNDDNTVREIIPDAAVVLGIEKCYGITFSAQCVEASDNVYQNWIYDSDNMVFLEPIQPDFTGEIVDDVETLQTAVETLKLENTTLQTTVDLLTIAILEG